jgi:hypothetical protein
MEVFQMRKPVQINILPREWHEWCSLFPAFLARMNADEKDIVDYLKCWPKSYISGREIARKVGGKARYEEDRGWAIPILAQMVRIGLIETDSYGGFRLIQQDKKKKRNPREVSPQILRILKSSGKSFDGITIDQDVGDEN